MKNNQVILEDNYFINKDRYIDKNKQKSNLFSNFSNFYFSFISILLILNLYFIVKLVIYQRNRDINFLQNEIKLKYTNNRFKTGKENQDNKHLEINSNKKYLNYKNISLEEVDLDLLKLIKNEIQSYIELTLEEQ